MIKNIVNKKDKLMKLHSQLISWNWFSFGSTKLLNSCLKRTQDQNQKFTNSDIPGPKLSFEAICITCKIYNTSESFTPLFISAQCPVTTQGAYMFSSRYHGFIYKNCFRSQWYRACQILKSGNKYNLLFLD